MTKLGGVSVIICCYNSATRIENTLKYLSQQQLVPGISLEIILVDNASDDTTVTLAQKAWQKLDPKIGDLKIVSEIKAGVAHARKKGILAASHKYLIFCDDDNWLDEYYINIVFDFFEENIKVAAIGGYGEPVFEDNCRVPDWFDRFYASYALGPQAPASNTSMTAVYGAGMAVRKTVVETALLEHPFLLEGRKRNTLSAGEDSEICFRIRLKGHQIAYLENLRFKHYMPGNRLSWSYIKKLHRGLADTFVMLDLYQRALNSEQPELPFFYWLSKSCYYWGIYFKYWPAQYGVFYKREGTMEEIRHITWRKIAENYGYYNFQTRRFYHKIFTLKS